MNCFRSFYKFGIHFFSARHTRGFGVHSPYLFQFVSFVLREKLPFYSFGKIEKLRSDMLQDQRVLHITDAGTGTDRQAKVSSIARRSVKSAKYGQLLFRIAHYFRAETILELGTSLGVTTAYLAAPSSGSRCISLEGCPEIAGVARENLARLDMDNAEVVVGNIDETLDGVLKSVEQLDLVFFDANHRREALLRYFNACLPKVHDRTVFVIDDIYWSADMEQAWKEIKACPGVVATIDLFQVGIVFFNRDLYNKHYKMRY